MSRKKGSAINKREKDIANEHDLLFRRIFYPLHRTLVEAVYYLRNPPHFFINYYHIYSDPQGRITDIIDVQ